MGARCEGIRNLRNYRKMLQKNFQLIKSSEKRFLIEFEIHPRNNKKKCEIILKSIISERDSKQIKK